MFRDVPAAELAATVIAGCWPAPASRPTPVDDVILGQCYPNGEAPAIGRVAALDAGLPVTVPGSSSTGAAARACRRSSTPPCRSRPGRRRGAGRRRRVDEPGRVLHDRHALGRPGRERAALRPAGPGPGDRRRRATTRCPGGMLETAENLRREYAHRPRGAGRARPALPPAGGGRPGGGPVRRRDRPGRRSRARKRRRRSSTPTSTPGPTPPRALAALRPVMRPRGPRGHGDRRQRQRAERRRRRCASSPPPRRPPSSGCARWPGWRRGPSPASSPATHGHRPGAGDGQGAGAGRADAGRHRPDRAERGVRRPGAGLHPRVGVHRAPTSSG